MEYCIKYHTREELTGNHLRYLIHSSVISSPFDPPPRSPPAPHLNVGTIFFSLGGCRLANSSPNIEMGGEGGRGMPDE